MLTRRHRLVTPAQAPVWGRRKLLGLLGGALLSAVALVVGLVVAVVSAAPHHGRTVGVAAAAAILRRPGSGTTPTPGRSTASASAVAAAPMPSVDLTAAQPAPVSTRAPGTIVLPAPAAVGPAGVPTGYPDTPDGALAQLAALDQTAMQTATMAGVRAVITDWAASGGPTPSTWSGVTAMAGFLTAAGLSGGGSPQLALVVTPLMGLIKGNVGPNISVVCVDFEFDATFVQTSRIADADCQTMVWRGSRWMIGPGPEPAAPPAVWPDTGAAINAGYADLRRG